MLLYSYPRSSASYRVRIVLDLKGIPYDLTDVDLSNDEHKKQDYYLLNAQCLVPTLIDGATIISQSTAIIEYLEETHPSPPLLPPDPQGRAHVRSICQFIACEMQPLTNARVLHRLLSQSPNHTSENKEWAQHWITVGLQTLEDWLSKDVNTKRFCHGNQPTLADAYLIPQMFLAKRFLPSLSKYETLCAIENNCLSMSSFKND